MHFFFNFIIQFQFLTKNLDVGTKSIILNKISNSEKKITQVVQFSRMHEIFLVEKEENIKKF